MKKRSSKRIKRMPYLFTKKGILVNLFFATMWLCEFYLQGVGNMLVFFYKLYLILVKYPQIFRIITPLFVISNIISTVALQQELSHQEKVPMLKACRKFRDLLDSWTPEVFEGDRQGLRKSRRTPYIYRLTIRVSGPGVSVGSGSG